MKILAIETSTDACSVAFMHDENITQVLSHKPRHHAQLILPMIEKLLNDQSMTLSDLDAIAYAQGPGSFTGLRIASSVTQGLAFGANKPVIAISTLRALAHGVWREHRSERVLAVLDARMQEVYWGVYAIKDNIMMPLSDECVSSPDQVKYTYNNDICGVGAGSGWGVYQDALHTASQNHLTTTYPDFYPQAYDVVQLAAYEYQQGHMVQAHEALPMYIRNKVTH